MNKKYKYNYPEEIESFFDFYEFSDLNSEEAITSFIIHIGEVQDYLIKEYERIFGSTELLDGDYVCESIFPAYITRLPEKQQIKLNLCSAIRVLNHLVADFEFRYESELKENRKTPNFKPLTHAIFYLIDDFMVFYADYYEYFHLNANPFLALKRMEAFSTFDSVELSSQLLKGKIDYDYFSMSKVIPGAISFIRQTIELILKNELNIHLITNSNGKPLKISGYMFFEFYKTHQENIQFPCKFSHLKKAYEWSNSFIHAGNVNYYWTIWEAQLIIYSFFPFKEEYDTSHFIIFDEDMVDNIEKKIQEFLSKKMKIEPGSIIIEFHNKYGGLTTQKNLEQIEIFRNKRSSV